MLGTSNHFLKLKKKNKFLKTTKVKAKKIISEIRTKGVIYEGVNLKVSKKNMSLALLSRDLLYSLKSEVKKYNDINSRNDNHDPGFIKFWYFKNIGY